MINGRRHASHLERTRGILTNSLPGDAGSQREGTQTPLAKPAVQGPLLTLGDSRPELPGIPHPLEVPLDALRAHAEAIIASMKPRTRVPGGRIAYNCVVPVGTLDDVVSASRILVYGVTGSGKSTAALSLGEILELPVHLVDEEFG